jgi:tetratricopeptide (TPR) repeat protein
LSLDANLAEAHASLGAVFGWVDGNQLLAEREYQRALRLDPRYAPAHDWYALQLAAGGRTDSAVAEATVAHDLDPTSLAIGADLATVLLWAGRPQAAIRQWRGTLALDSSYQRAHKQLWRTYALAGRWDAAVGELDQLMRLEGAPERTHLALHRAYAERGWQGVLEWRLRALTDSFYGAASRPVEAASLCVLLGRREDALTWLRRAHDTQNQYLRFARLDPAFASLRADPRFLALLPTEEGTF